MSAGAVVAGFRIESLVGRGAMAEVYRARDETERVVALKLLDEVLDRDQRFRRRFLRESEIAATLDHPNVVRTLGSGESAGRLYLAMEHVEGSDLRRLLREEGRLDPERAVAIVGQVAGALDAAHTAGLVHRDVKPGNILVDTRPDGDHAYVCDFGLARHVSSVGSLTGDRGFVGTIDYVPPEQIEGGAVDGRADVYSLGCVLYECLAGMRPFERDSELSTVFAHLNEPPPQITDDRPELPAAFDEVIATALAKAPDDRYSSCGELAAAGGAALRGEVVAPRRRRRRFVPVAVCAVGVAAAAAVGGLLLFTGKGSSEPVTITPTTLAGGKLGDSSAFLQRLWGTPLRQVSTQTPADYAVLSQSGREVSAYFLGTDDRAIEFTTWNSSARTVEGVGPCSTLAQLRKAYGKRLKPSPNNTHNGVVFGYMVGRHLFFAMGPGATPKIVEAVALYSNKLSEASFNALNEGPCAKGAQTLAVARPVTTTPSASATPALTRTLTSRRFKPRVTVRTPEGWSVRTDNGRVFNVAAATGTSITFRLDPLPTAPSGRPLSSISTTPNGLVRWLQKQRRLVVTAPSTGLLGKPALTTSTVNVRSRAGDVSYLTLRGPGYAFPLRATAGSPVELRLTGVRIGTLVHTLAFAIESPSQAAFDRAKPTADAILSTLRVGAVPVLPLSSLSSLCTRLYQGTCLGELTAGTHSTSTFRPQLTYTVPVGWTNYSDRPSFVNFVPPGGDWRGVDPEKSDFVGVMTSIAAASAGCAGASTVHTPAAYARWLGRQPGLAITRPTPVTLGGLSGLVVDIRVRKTWKRTCPWSKGSPVVRVITGRAPTPPELDHVVIAQPMVMRLYLLGYRKGTLGIEIDALKGSKRLAEYTAVVKTFRFKQ
ncbi:MAG TPA: serine/threonine-protein kinase [Gaiellaceae bacterium]|nr:serine/threonine-protein kinase [Gaiellaceae bacterium]